MDIRRTEKEETYTRKVPYLVIELSVAEARDLIGAMAHHRHSETALEFYRQVSKFLADSPQNDW